MLDFGEGAPSNNENGTAPRAVVALQQIRDNREAIDLIVEELLETETMDGERFREILAQYATIPDENIPREIVMA